MLFLSTRVVNGQPFLYCSIVWQQICWTDHWTLFVPVKVYLHWQNIDVSCTKSLLLSFARHLCLKFLSKSVFFPKFELPNSGCGLSVSAAYVPVFTVNHYADLKFVSPTLFHLWIVLSALSKTWACSIQICSVLTCWFILQTWWPEESLCEAGSRLWCFGCCQQGLCCKTRASSLKIFCDLG